MNASTSKSAEDIQENESNLRILSFLVTYSPLFFLSKSYELELLFYSCLEIFIFSANDGFLMNESLLGLLRDVVTVEVLIDPRALAGCIVLLLKNYGADLLVEEAGPLICELKTAEFLILAEINCLFYLSAMRSFLSSI